jgi:hypothetical protein
VTSSRVHFKSPHFSKGFWVVVHADPLGQRDKSCSPFSSVCSWCIDLVDLLEKGEDILSFFFDNDLQQRQQEPGVYTSKADMNIPQATLVLW